MTESLDLFTDVEPSSLSDLGDILAYQLFDQRKRTGSTKVCVWHLACVVLDLLDLAWPLSSDASSLCRKNPRPNLSFRSKKENIE